MLPFEKNDLVKAIDEDLVTQRKHPDLPLWIYNYGPEVQYRKLWNDVTLNCRGLILDEDFNIVARPWKKFFNLGQVNLPIQFDDRVEVMDKADGSLGILYNNAYNWVEGNLWIPDSFAIATRGSFVSEQAIGATKIWNESYSDIVVPDGFTFLFEILLPWNRIVLNYDYDSKYLQQGRGSLSQRSARNDPGEHVHSTEEWLEDLSSMQIRGSEAGPSQECGEAQRECQAMACSECGKITRIWSPESAEDSATNLGVEERQAMRGLRADISSGVHGLRPSAGYGEEIQCGSCQKPRGSGRGSEEVRTSLFELSQNKDIRYTPGNLVLLGAVENRSGYYHGPREAAAYLGWTGPVVEVMPYKSISEAIANMGRKNREGYVIRSHNFMVKVKEPDYLDLHRLVTNVSPKTVWEQLKAGKSVEQIVSVFPDEFHDYVESMANPLVARYQVRIEAILSEYQRLASKVRAGRAVDGGVTVSRKEYAKAFTKHPDARYFFLLLDNKSIVDVLWAELKPREGKNVRSDAD